MCGFSIEERRRCGTKMKTKQKKLTRKQAVRECKDFWTKIKEDGGSKVHYLHTHDVNYGACNCPLCQWVREGKFLGTTSDVWNKKVAKIDSTIYCVEYKRICPLVEQYGMVCLYLGYSEYSVYDRWLNYIMNLKEQ